MARKTLSVVSGIILASLALTASAWADGGYEKGEKVFKTKCKACHEIEKPVNKVGPNLICLVGRKAGALAGYKYSDAMAQSGLTWDEATLKTYLKKPADLVVKTKMTFAGLPKDEQIADLVAYLVHENEKASCK